MGLVALAAGLAWASPVAAQDGAATLAWVSRVDAALVRPGHLGPQPWPSDLSPPLVALRRIARDLLAEHGAELVDPGAAAQGRLAVTARLTALGQFYDYASDMKRFRAVIYPGAVVEGRIVLGRSPALHCTAVFAGQEPIYDVPLKGFGVDFRESPLHAPFDQAMEQPGGYIETLEALLAAAWPEDPAGPMRGVPVACRRAF